MRVLVVEDERKLAANVARALREGAGYAVDVAEDGQEGLYLATSGEYDLLVLDLMLPKLDGQALLTSYRAKGHQTPVLVLTARDEKEWVVRLLNAGADDYVAKPFDLGEFLARAKALVRRGKGQRSPIITVADLRFDTSARTVRRGQQDIALTPMEYRVLEYLAHRLSAVVSKTELLEHLYDYNWEKFSNVIEVYISGLRRKLDDGHAVETSFTRCAGTDTCCGRSGRADVKRVSLNSRIIGTVIACQLLLTAALTAASVLYARTESGRAFDAALAGRATSTLALVRYTESDPPDLLFDPSLLPPSSDALQKDLFEIRKTNGQLVARSNGSAAGPQPKDASDRNTGISTWCRRALSWRGCVAKRSGA